jgi:hypothetical protein
MMQSKCFTHNDFFLACGMSILELRTQKQGKGLEK